MSLLIHVRDLAGASPPALWEDIKFDARHYTDIERIALVGPGARMGLRALTSRFCLARILL